jgi:hypothetical protein
MSSGQEASDQTRTFVSFLFYGVLSKPQPNTQGKPDIPKNFQKKNSAGKHNYSLQNTIKE